MIVKIMHNNFGDLFVRNMMEEIPSMLRWFALIFKGLAIKQEYFLDLESFLYSMGSVLSVFGVKQIWILYQI